MLKCFSIRLSVLSTKQDFCDTKVIALSVSLFRNTGFECNNGLHCFLSPTSPSLSILFSANLTKQLISHVSLLPRKMKKFLMPPENDRTLYDHENCLARFSTITSAAARLLRTLTIFRFRRDLLYTRDDRNWKGKRKEIVQQYTNYV